MDDGTGSATPTALRVIRLALFAGVVTFGAVAWYVTREGPVSDVPEQTARYLSFVLIGLAVASLGALTVVRGVRANASEYARQGTLTVVGWSLGEAPALLGGVLYLLTGSPVPFVTGILVLLVGFVMLPVPDAP
jgi:hypothetical protein